MFNIILAAALGALGAVNLPKDTTLHRFVAPGQEQAVVPNLFKFEASLEDINEIDSPYGGVIPSASSSYYILDPQDASKMRVLMFYGIQNAKEMALRKLISQSKTKESPSDVTFSCVPYYPTSLRSAFSSKPTKHIQSGNWWFACQALKMD